MLTIFLQERCLRPGIPQSLLGNAVAQQVLEKLAAMKISPEPIFEVNLVDASDA